MLARRRWHAAFEFSSTSNAKRAFAMELAPSDYIKCLGDETETFASKVCGVMVFMHNTCELSFGYTWFLAIRQGANGYVLSMGAKIWDPEQTPEQCPEQGPEERPE